MRILKISKGEEKGIALIFTLIILSLLLILALGFAINSMFDQKAAGNAANASFAAFLAQTQLKQVLSLIKNNEANLEASQFYSHDSGSPAVTDTNMLRDMLQERLAVPDLLPVVDTSKVNWNYIRSEDLEKRIIGRTAFVVIANGIPLDSIISSKYDETLNAELRIGKDVSEINVSPAISSPTAAMINVFNWEQNKPVAGDGFAGGVYTGNWLTYDAIFKAIKAVAALNAAQQKDIRENLSIVNAKDKEAFWADTNGDTVIDSNELYKRFDLTRDWETANHAEDLTFIKDKILLTSGTVPDIDMESFTEADSDSNSKGLPWLACFGYKDDGTPYTLAELGSTFPSISAHRMQIAANLKDYCDKDGGVNRPTSDVDPASWYNHTSASTAPLFSGNEKTPYINKVGLEIVASSVVSSSSPYNTSGKVEIRPLVGLIDIYGASWPDDLKVRVTGKVTVACKIDSVSKILNIDPSTATNSEIPFNTVLDINGTGSASPNWPNSDGYSHFVKGTVCTGTTLNVGPTASAASVKIDITDIRIDKVILYDATTNSKGYDYVKDLSVADLPFTALSSSSGADDSKTSYYGLEVNDPRQNLNSGDWVQYSPSSIDAQQVFSLDSSDDTICKPNADNSNSPVASSPARVSPKDGSYAEETVTDPANNALSTAFIRNGPMESPWELGFIHRGKKWETINLKTYDSLKAYKTIDIGTAPNIKKYLAGGGLYGAGDANILDQIKMTAKAQSPQKINLKTQKTTTFDALFTKVKLGCGIDSTMSVNSIAKGVSPAGTDVDLSAVSYTDMRTAIIAFFKTTGTTNRTRASIAGQLVLPVGAATDAAKEELIGKIINLTELNGKVGSFTIIILAQMIKDVGGSYTGAGISLTKISDDGNAKTKTDCKIGQFDADIDISNSKDSVYYDEITAEQKIIVKGYRTIDGNIKITNFKYVD